MRIAIFTDTFLPQINGVTNTLNRMIKYLENNGIDYLVFAPGDLSKDISGDNIYRFLSFNFFLYPECKVAIPNYNKIKAKLEQFKPDLIHIVTPFNIGLAGLKFGKDESIPVVASYHTNFSQYLSYYKIKFIDKALWRYFAWFHNQCFMNFCPSNDTRQDLINHGIKNIAIWGRGIDYDLYSPQKRNQKLRDELGIGDRKAILYVGRISPEKDLDILIKSIESINNSIYKKDVCFVITGDGPMMNDIRNLKIDNIILTGYKKGEELSSIYASCDIFAFPSTTETYGNVILEAMSSGLPVIAPYSGGLTENLYDGYNSLCCRPRVPEDMTAAIIKLAENESLRQRLSRQAREYVRSKSWDSIFSKLVSDYCYVLQNFNKKTNISA